MMQFNDKDILNALKNVTFPDNGKDIVSLNMIENLKITNKSVQFSIVLPNLNNPFKPAIKKACLEAIHKHVNNSLSVDIGFIEKAKPKVAEAHQPLPGVKNIVAIASGKGGVGKSTVSANLAVALANAGFRVGLIDADVYGPSIPKMFGVENEHPVIRTVLEKTWIVPIEKYGVKLLSIGFFVKPEAAMIWRGPMATGALLQLINEALWGELDYMLIDLPPGTGDIHLTLVQTLSVTGVLIVSTPQQVAIADAIKGINMFRAEKINVPVLGLVENMAWFTPAELPANRYYIFGKDGCKNLAEQMNVPFLGQIPIVQSICDGGDSGKPVVIDADSLIGVMFSELAVNLVSQVDLRNEQKQPTEVVKITHTDSCAAKEKE